MNIKETFLKLTSRTYPHGSESELDGFLPKEMETDEFGNKFIQIGESTCMFTCHLDTATSANTEVNHVIDGNIIKTDGKSILGADDKAGVTILLYMIENKIPGLYYFFLGEEVGCVGSRKLSTKIKDLVSGDTDNPWKKFNKVIAFDRRGYDSVITHQSSSRCCSDEFAKELADELNRCGPVSNIDIPTASCEALKNWINNPIEIGQNPGFIYKIDPTGIYTDSAQFTKIYPECTNISVGYKSEHCFTEQQDILHLEQLAKACLKIKWETLPVKRDPSKVEYSSHGYYGYGYWESEWDDYYNQPPARSKSSYTPIDTDENLYFHDDEYRYVSSVKRKKFSNILLSVDFADERIENEKDLITNLLTSLEIDYSRIEWNGFKLLVYYNLPAGHKTECDRTEIAEFLSELDFWKREVDDIYKQETKKLENIF